MHTPTIHLVFLSLRPCSRLYIVDVFIEQDAFLVEGIIINEDTSLRDALQQILSNLVDLQGLKHLKKVTIGNIEEDTNSDNSHNQYGHNHEHKNIMVTFMVRSKDDGVWHLLRMVQQLMVFDELRITTSAAYFPCEGYSDSTCIEVDRATTNLMKLRHREVLSDED